MLPPPPLFGLVRSSIAAPGGMAASPTQTGPEENDGCGSSPKT
jgi:hypothetical protein